MSLEVNIEKKRKGFTLKVDFATAGVAGILGASGCGKSMTLKCIAGIETPDCGRIVVNGRVFFDSEKKINMKVQERRVGYLFQSYALFPNMTIRQNLEIAMPKTPKRSAVIDRYLELLQIKSLAQRYPKQLSGGQQQRAALARILVSSPELLMLDEPFSALDYYLKETLQMELLEILRDYQGDLLMVTHSRDEVYRFCEQIFVLNEGRIVANGETKAVFQNPVSAAAAKLTGCKNITAVRKISPQSMRAEKWNLILSTTGSIPDTIKYIGIRAHDLRAKTASDQHNVLPCQSYRIMEDLFEVTLVINDLIWWKLSKESWYLEYHQKVPEFLVLPQEKLLLLGE